MFRSVEASVAKAHPMWSLSGEATSLQPVRAAPPPLDSCRAPRTVLADGRRPWRNADMTMGGNQ